MCPLRLNQAACTRRAPIPATPALGAVDAERGSRVKAYIVLASGFDANAETADSIRQFVRDAHSQFDYPKVIEFLDELPSSQSGKVNRKALRERCPITEF
ncbi:AMP-binding enzyme [Paraburkholderia fungorum]|uniref:AMP-binding enzyme n=1 Tax=Paraburkholderia fungorum TaxID=134537 RepID=UPI0038B8D5C3